MVSRGADRRRQLPPLCGEGPTPDASSRRYRGHGQLGQPQKQNRAPAHPLRGSQALLPAKILTDLNPIEQVFAKLKHFLRKAAARTVDAVCLAIGEVLQLFSPGECASYLANSGYGQT